jgi:hypothetical protein
MLCPHTKGSSALFFHNLKDMAKPSAEKTSSMATLATEQETHFQHLSHCFAIRYDQLGKMFSERLGRSQRRIAL